jgi:SAM-dependent methyltransferase
VTKTPDMNPFDNETALAYVRVRQKFISELLDSIRGQVTLGSAIDLGCGVGYFSQFLAKRGLHVTAVDGREENVSEGQRRHPGITFLARNAEDPHLSDLGTFDLGLCVGLLYHLENPFQAIRNLYALTNKVLVVESMCIPGGEPRLLLLVEGRQNNQGLNHVAFYPTEFCLIKMLGFAGFPRVYRFRKLPPDRQFNSTLLRKRSRTFLVASKVELAAGNLVPALEGFERYANPWHTALSGSVHFCYRKLLSAKNRLARTIGPVTSS